MYAEGRGYLVWHSGVRVEVRIGEGFVPGTARDKKLAGVFLSGFGSRKNVDHGGCKYAVAVRRRNRNYTRPSILQNPREENSASRTMTVRNKHIIDLIKT